MLSLSIIFPVFNEESKITNDLIRADRFIRSEKIDGEIIVVDDGSEDSTLDTINNVTDQIESELRVIHLDQNTGKGGAIKKGIESAEKEYLLYSDVGNIVPFEFALKGLHLLKIENADIAHGSRKLKKSIIAKEQDPDRKILSWVFNKIVKTYLNIPKEFSDTQCGFKLYRKEVGKELYAELKTFGFLFELEIILRALRKGYKIVEFPVQWKCDRDSRISLFKTTPEVIREIFKIKRMF